MTAQQKDPKENLTREQTVIAYTKGSAYAEFAEKGKGTLAKEMLTDLAVFITGYMYCPISTIASYIQYNDC